MKCPCCKYEQKDSIEGYVDVEKTITSGKNKGKTKIIKEWKIIEESIGEEPFQEINILAIENNWDRASTTNLFLNICPKCGTAFKDV